ncbi:2-alkenal reductase [Winogradskyella haliclonae]|uniref:2-alkenal reductase n=2 Tax=Winogradskyella haliclonae TaxID=2048558 RepID=A0ABQ2BYJ3_9FLAO|nr:2-alkenal reductase [Winogradskyella haliclonae]
MTTVNSQDLSEVYNKVSPAVVAIFTQEETLTTTNDNKTVVSTKNGLGSGFMITNKLVVTAAHVVKVPEKLIVQFSDGETIPAKVVTSYEAADIALIELFIPKINAVTVSFGDSGSMKIGNQVFVVGVPLGVGFSMSSGYISAFKKESLGENPFTTTDFIQTDAAINQGNSGGPMFNLKGEVIGIVSHIKTKSGGSDGIGFATSSNLAAKLLLNNKMPWFGAEFHTLKDKEAKIFNLPQKYGLLVQRVASSSIFDKMGVKGGDTEISIGNQKFIAGGDIILAFNSIRFELSDEALLKLADFAKSIGDKPKFNITVLRAGKLLTLEYSP